MATIEIRNAPVPMDSKAQIASLEAKLARVREEYNNLKLSRSKYAARDERAMQVIRNLAPLMELFTALDERLTNSQREILDVLNGHAESKTLFATAETLGKLAARVRRMSSELTPDPTETH